jgi:hypothetical protein
MGFFDEFIFVEPISKTWSRRSVSSVASALAIADFGLPLQPQITRIEHITYANTYIRELIDDREEYEKELESAKQDLEAQESESAPGMEPSHEAAPLSRSTIPVIKSRSTKFHKVYEGGNVILASRQSIRTFKSLQEEHAANPLLRNFCTKLSSWLTVTLPTYGEELPEGGRVRMQPDDEVCDYQHLLPAGCRNFALISNVEWIRSLFTA